MIQPIDQCVIASLKLKYHKKVKCSYVNFIADNIGEKNLQQFLKSFNILNAIKITFDCCNDLSERAIVNSYKKLLDISYDDNVVTNDFDIATQMKEIEVLLGMLDMTDNVHDFITPKVEEITE